MKRSPGKVLKTAQNVTRYAIPPYDGATPTRAADESSTYISRRLALCNEKNSSVLPVNWSERSLLLWIYYDWLLQVPDPDTRKRFKKRLFFMKRKRPSPAFPRNHCNQCNHFFPGIHVLLHEKSKKPPVKKFHRRIRDIDFLVLVVTGYRNTM